MKMLNKKGYLRTVEAIIALVIVLIVTFYAIPKEKVDITATPNIVSSSQDIIKKEMLLDEDLKVSIISNNPDAKKDIAQILEKNKPVGFIYAFRVCDNPTCLCIASTADCIKPSEKLPSDAASNVYMSDVFVSAVIGGTAKHAVIRFWMWQG